MTNINSLEKSRARLNRKMHIAAGVCLGVAVLIILIRALTS